MAQREPGAYGFRLEGVPNAGAHLLDGPAHWSRLTLVRGHGQGRPKVEEVMGDHARLWPASGAYAELDRAPARALVDVSPDTSDGALVHRTLLPWR